MSSVWKFAVRRKIPNSKMLMASLIAAVLLLHAPVELQLLCGIILCAMELLSMVLRLENQVATQIHH